MAPFVLKFKVCIFLSRPLCLMLMPLRAAFRYPVATTRSDAADCSAHWYLHMLFYSPLALFYPICVIFPLNFHAGPLLGSNVRKPN